jgi:uncharacterized protein involved in response to NO
LLLWALGRLAVLLSTKLDVEVAAVIDLAFPALFVGVVAREIFAGRNWRNLPMVGVLALLLVGNLLVHLDAVGIAATAELGDRIGIATLLMLISLVGGRIIPSFTRNWLAKDPRFRPPRSMSGGSELASCGNPTPSSISDLVKHATGRGATKRL